MVTTLPLTYRFDENFNYSVIISKQLTLRSKAIMVQSTVELSECELIIDVTKYPLTQRSNGIYQLDFISSALGDINGIIDFSVDQQRYMVRAKPVDLITHKFFNAVIIYQSE